MANLLHEIWMDPANEKEYPSCILAGPKGDFNRKKLNPNAKIVHRFWAKNHFEVMTNYNAFLGFEPYKAHDERDYDPLPAEWGEGAGVVKVGIGVAVKTSQGYVFMKRQGSFGAGLWCFPGGKLDFGESVVECAVRETWEETGLVLEQGSIIPIVSEDMLEDVHYITLYVHGFAKGEPKIMEPHKATEICILGRHQNLPTPTFPGTDKVWNHSFREYDFDSAIFFGGGAFGQIDTE